MKKLLAMILIILSCLFTTGCTITPIEKQYDRSDLQYLLLNKSTAKQKYINTEEYNNFIRAVGEFSTDLSEKVYLRYNEKYDRLAISPISIYMALAMMTGVALEEVQDELVNLLGIPYDMIVEYTKYLYSSLNREQKADMGGITHSIQLSNSVWLNDNVEHKDDGIELLRNAFYTDSYAVPFTIDNESANKAVKDYICRNTKGLINKDYNFDQYTLFLLINTLYLKDAWDIFGDPLPYTQNTYDFKNQNGTTKSMKLLKGDYFRGAVQQGDGFEYFYTSTSHRVKLYFIKPTFKSLDEIYNKDNLDTILSDDDYNYINEDLKEEYYTRCLFPEFDASFDENLSSLFSEDYGVSKMFRETIANFDKVTDEICYIKQMTHQTKLIVDKKGIEGAAVTISAAGGTGLPSETYKKIYYDFIINQSFGFMMTIDNVVLFSGVVNNI